MGYLDNEGLARLWGKTRAYARSAYTAGVGIEIAEGAISLETPTVPITQAEYEALSEEEREGKLFLVTDAPAHEGFPCGMTVYSEEETAAGTWIDGKPIYRKVIAFRTPGNSSRAYIADISNLNWDVIMRFDAYVINHKTGKQFAYNTMPPYYIEYDATHKDSFTTYISDNQIYIQLNGENGWDCPGYIILEYTKTTDPEGTVTPLPANCVQSYDTEDGWHVRKYADGYVEQIYKKLVTIAVADWVSILTNESGNGVYSVGDPYFPPVALPVAMTEKLGEVYSVASGNWSTIAAHAGVSASNQVNPNTHIDRFALYRMGTPITSPLTCTMTVMVTGRWK